MYGLQVPSVSSYDNTGFRTKFSTFRVTPGNFSDHGNVSEEGTIAWYLNKLSIPGGRYAIELVPGIYNVETTIAIPENVSIHGPSRLTLGTDVEGDVPVFRLGSGSANPLFLIQGDNVTLSNFCVDSELSLWNSYFISVPVGVAYLSLLGLFSRFYASHPINIVDTRGILIENCRFGNGAPGSNYVNKLEGCSRAVIKDSYLGVTRFLDSQDISVSGCVFRNFRDDYQYLLNTANTTDLVITSNFFDGDSDGATPAGGSIGMISLYNSDNCLVASNQYGSVDNYGYAVSVTSIVPIVGIHIAGEVSTGTPGQAIVYLGTNSSQCSVFDLLGNPGPLGPVRDLGSGNVIRA